MWTAVVLDKLKYRFGNIVAFLRKAMKSQSEQMVVVAGFEYREFSITKWWCLPLNTSICRSIDGDSGLHLARPSYLSFIVWVSARVA